MTKPSKKFAPHTPLLHGLAGFAGMAVGCAVLACVTVLFGEASSMPWLNETPSNVATMKRCDAVVGSAGRRACAETVLSTVLAPDSATRVARSEPAHQPDH